MIKKCLIVAIMAALLVTRGLACASDEAVQEQINELKDQLRKMADRYETRISELELRVARYEIKASEEHAHGEDAHGHDEEVPGQSHHHGLLGGKVKPIGAIDARFVRVEEGKNTLMLHEAKAGVQADITDWLFGFITFTKHHGEEVEIEEAYARLHFDELGLSAKPGKFFVNFGPENLAHFFDRRTITLSAMHEGLFGHEPWADIGVQFDWKLPVDFYSNLSFSVVNGNNGATYGDGENAVSNNNLPIVLDWTNVFDTDYGLFKMGPSFSWGQWDSNDKYNVYLAGGNAYYKIGNFDAQAELIYRYKEQMPGVGGKNAYGYYVWGAYAFPLDYKYLRAIEVLGGFGQFIPDMRGRETRITPQISFIINDYAKLRATYEVRDQSPRDRKDNRFISQFALAF